jgi:hypothetical protein
MRCYVPAVLLLLVANPAVAQRSGDPLANCPLFLDGTGIKQVSLEADHGSGCTLLGTNPVAMLRPGRYRVHIIILKGDYTYAAPREGGQWFTLVAETPYHLRAGGPLVPQVQVERLGRTLRMEYQGMADAAGRLYHGKNAASLARDHPTHFTVHRDGREIAAGTLRYGKYG